MSGLPSKLTRMISHGRSIEGRIFDEYLITHILVRWERPRSSPVIEDDGDNQISSDEWSMFILSCLMIIAAIREN